MAGCHKYIVIVALNVKSDLFSETEKKKKKSNDSSSAAGLRDQMEILFCYYGSVFLMAIASNHR
jgi:hypothetical protein